MVTEHQVYMDINERGYLIFVKLKGYLAICINTPHPHCCELVPICRKDNSSRNISYAHFGRA